MKRLALTLTLSLGALAALAPGVWASDIQVNTTADGAPVDDGDCTLREAIVAANTDTASGAMTGECIAGDAGNDSIIFDNPPFDGAVGTSTINVGSALPTVTDALEIKGNNCTGTGDGEPCVGIHMTVASTDALASTSLNQFEVEGLAITNADEAVTGENIEATRSWFGIKLDQSVAKNRIGITAGNSSTIGGSTAAERNVFAANNSGPLSAGQTGAGVLLFGADGAQVTGNFFSVNPAGALATGMQNGDNVRVVDAGADDASGNVIGGTEGGDPALCDGVCNLLANAIRTGVTTFSSGGPESPGTGGLEVQGNHIGLSLNGTADFSNGDGGVANDAADLQLGGIDALDRNYIAGHETAVFSGTDGTLFAGHNFIGTNSAGTAKVPASPTETSRSLVTEGTADIQDNVIGGSFAALGGTNTIAQGNSFGVGIGGTDVGMNGYAVFITGDFVDFGGGDPGEGNVVGFQTGDPFAAVGVVGGMTGATDPAIMGNYIGTDASGASYPNEGFGIEVGVFEPAEGTVIGGCPACANVISNSGTDAIRIELDGSDENHVSYNTGRNNGRLDINGPTNDLFLDLGTNGQGNGANGPNEGIEAPGIGNGLTLSAATTTQLSGTSSEPNGTNVHVYTTYTRFADLKAFVADGVVSGGAWTVTYPTPLARGTCITAAQVDGNNNTSELAPPVAVSGNGGVCDRIRPRTRITRVRRSFGGQGGKVTIRFRSNEKGAKFQCSRQLEKFRRCRSPKTFRRLPDGECHRVRVRAVDQAGNKDRTPAKVRVCVPPDTR